MILDTRPLILIIEKKILHRSLIVEEHFSCLPIISSLHKCIDRIHSERKMNVYAIDEVRVIIENNP